MQGVSYGRPTLGMGDLAHLKKSVIWSSQSNPTIRKGALQERLEELLVLELHKDGGRAFLSFTVRGLYKHVLKAITSKISGKRERDEVNFMIEKKGGPRRSSMGETINSPVVLGALSSHHEEEHEDDDRATTTSKHDETETLGPKVEPIIEEPIRGAKSPEITKRIAKVKAFGEDISERAVNATYRDRLGGYLYV